MLGDCQVWLHQQLKKTLKPSGKKGRCEAMHLWKKEATWII